MTIEGRVLLYACIAMPVIGVVVLVILKRRLSDERRRTFSFIWLAVIAATLILVGLRITDVAVIPFWDGLYPQATSLTWGFDDLSLSFSLLVTIGLATLYATHNTMRPTLVLTATAAAIVTILAANLPALCIGWALVDIYLFFEDARRTSRSSSERAPRALTIRTLSTVALLAGASLLMSDQGTTRVALLTLTPLAKALLMAAALLRLAPYPLPRSGGRSPMADIMTTVTGGYLWIRVMTLSPGTLPGATWLVPLVGTTLLTTGVLSALSTGKSAARPYAVAHWSSLLVLAPLLDVPQGTRIAVLAGVNLLLAVISVEYASDRVEPGRARWAGETIISASVAGLPFTAGFLTRWALLSLALTIKDASLFAVALLSFCLISIPSLRRLIERWKTRKQIAPGCKWPRNSDDLALLVTAGVLIVAGTCPDLLARSTPYAANRFLFPSVADLARGGLYSYLTAAACLLAPWAFLWGAQRLRRQQHPAIVQALETSMAVLELDWLYSRIGRQLSRARGVLARTLSVLEGPMALGWIVLCLVILLTYGTGG